MKDGLIELVFILDKSGSAEHFEEVAIGCYNKLFESQQKIGRDCTVSTVLFDDEYNILHDRISFFEVKPSNTKQRFTKGTSAFLDAVGATIDSIGLALHKTPEHERPEKVIFIIIVDKIDNCSYKYTYEHIKEQIKLQTETYNWEFIFLGGDIEVEAIADEMGIPHHRVAEFVIDEEGIMGLLKHLTALVKRLRCEPTYTASEHITKCIEKLKAEYVKKTKPKKQTHPKGRHTHLKSEYQ